MQSQPKLSKHSKQCQRHNVEKSCVSWRKLRKNKEALGKLVSYEMGKSLQEGYGEVQK